MSCPSTSSPSFWPIRIQILHSGQPPSGFYSFLSDFIMSTFGMVSILSSRSPHFLNDLRTVVCAKEPMTVQHWRLFLVSLKSKFDFHYSHCSQYCMCKTAQMDRFPLSMHHFPTVCLINFDPVTSTARTKHSEVLANLCSDLMKAQLRFNICKLESSFVFDEDVLDLQDRIKEFISPALSYACRYWGWHLRQGNFTDRVHEKLVDFLTHYFGWRYLTLNEAWR